MLEPNEKDLRRIIERLDKAAGLVIRPHIFHFFRSGTFGNLLKCFTQAIWPCLSLLLRSTGIFSLLAEARPSDRCHAASHRFAEGAAGRSFAALRHFRQLAEVLLATDARFPPLLIRFRW